MSLIHQRLHGDQQMARMNAKGAHPVATLQSAHIDHDTIKHLHQVIERNEQIRAAIPFQLAAIDTTSQQPQTRSILFQSSADQGFIQSFRARQQVFQGVLVMYIQIENTALGGLGINRQATFIGEQSI